MMLNTISNNMKLWKKELRKTLFRGRQTALGLMLLMSIGVTLAVALPVRSQDSQSPIELSQQGQEYYAAGQLNRAIENWQLAAAAYTVAEDEAGIRQSYLNTATAQQALGLYDSLL